MVIVITMMVMMMILNMIMAATVKMKTWISSDGFSIDGYDDDEMTMIKTVNGDNDDDDGDDDDNMIMAATVKMKN